MSNADPTGAPDRGSARVCVPQEGRPLRASRTESGGDDSPDRSTGGSSALEPQPSPQGPLPASVSGSRFFTAPAAVFAADIGETKTLDCED